MEIVRVRNAQTLDVFRPHFTFTDPDMQFVFEEDLTRKLLHAPEDVLFLAAVGEEGGVEAFGIAYNLGLMVPYCYLAMAWAAPGTEGSVTREIFSRIVLWALTLGKKYVKAETRRSTEALLRSWAFEPFSVNVAFDLTGLKVPTVFGD